MSRSGNGTQNRCWVLRVRVVMSCEAFCHRFLAFPEWQALSPHIGRPPLVASPSASGLSIGWSVKEVCHDCRCGNRERSGCGVDGRERTPRAKTIAGETPLPKNEGGGSHD